MDESRKLGDRAFLDGLRRFYRRHRFRRAGFGQVLAALTDAGVSYIVVGVGGINFYARTPAEAFATLDLDALLEPRVANLQDALRVLSRLGYRFEAGGEPFLDTEDEGILAGVIRNGGMLSALHEAEGEIDLLLSISGFAFADLAEDATPFRVAEAEVRVGSLEKLLRSKEASGRPRDLAFLKAFEARSYDEESEG